MAGIAARLASAPVTLSLKVAEQPGVLSRWPWSITNGSWSATEGWSPPSFAAGAPAGARGGLFWNDQLLAGGDAYTILERGPDFTESNERQFSVWLFSAAGESPSGYQLVAWQTGTDNTYTFKLRKWVGGVETLLAEVAGVVMKANGAFAVVAYQGKVSMRVRETAESPFALVGAEVVDATFTEGRSGFDGNGSNPRVRNFATGTLGLYVHTPQLVDPDRYLTWELCDRKQNVLSELVDRRPGAKVELGLNKMAIASVPLSLEHEAHALVDALDTVLRVTLHGPAGFTRPVFIGRVMVPESKSETGTRELTLNAVDPMFQLERSLIRKVAGAVWEALAFKGVDQSLIMWELIAALVAGHGVVKGSIPASKNRDRTYPPGKEVGLSLVQMSEVIDGPDFELTPTVASDGTLATFNTYYPRLGSDKSASIVFVHGRSPHTAYGFTHAPAGDAIANVVMAMGAPQQEPTEASPFGIYPGYLAEHAASIAALGRFEKRLQLEDVVETATLEAHAKAAVAAGAFAVDLFDFTAAPERWTEEQGGDGVPPEFGVDYWLGDTIGCHAYLNGEDEAPMKVTGRITDAVLAELESGQMQVNLTCAPEVTVAGVAGSAITLKVPESP